MKLELNDIISVNQEIFNFLYHFQFGNTAVGSDYYLLRKITKKNYCFKEVNISYGLRRVKRLLKVDIELFDSMTEKYTNLCNRVKEDERIEILTKTLQSQTKHNNICKNDSEEDENCQLLRELLKVV